MTRATVIIPTLCRPEQLSNALASLLAMRSPQTIQRVIVVDNDPAASARTTVQSHNAASPFEIIWVHEPRAGIAHARNTGVAHAADAELIAFLDDDEVASTNWLKHLVDVQHSTGADAVFGPIAGKAPHADQQMRDFIEDFFSRHGPANNGLIEHYYGCGNSLLYRPTTLVGATPFALQSNETGGEDDILFSALKASGKRFAWAAEAWVDEVAPPNRTTLKYVMKRAFAYGQGPSQTAAENKRWAALMGWMGVGFGQALVFAPAALLARFIKPARYPYILRRCVEGVGKVFWFKGFEPKLYGQSELERVRKS